MMVAVVAIMLIMTYVILVTMKMMMVIIIVVITYFPLQKENVSVKTLDISMNGIGRDGAEAIGHALKHNRTMRMLKMRACRVNVDGLVLLFTRMNGNDTLKHIDVSLKR